MKGVSRETQWARCPKTHQPNSAGLTAGSVTKVGVILTNLGGRNGSQIRDLASVDRATRASSREDTATLSLLSQRALRVVQVSPGLLVTRRQT